MATTLHLVRHASTGALGRVLAGREEGWPLNAAGVAEARALADQMSALQLQAVLTSPRARARSTAATIAARHSLQVHVAEGFDEIDFGAWTGQSFAVLHDDPRWLAWNRQRGLAAVPGGETMALAQARALAAVAGLREAWPQAEVAIVSHSDVIKSVILGLLGAPLDLMHRMVIHPASRSVVRLHAHDTEVLVVNLPIVA